MKAYADATNRGDMTAYVDMYGKRPDLIVVNDGEITRGIDAVRNEANQMMGQEGNYKISIGTIDVIPLGQTRAVAVFPFAMTVQTQQGPVQLRAAMTLVLEKGSQGWKIIHDHTSSVAPTNASGGAMAPAAPAAAPVSVAAAQTGAQAAPQRARTTIAEAEAAILQPAQFLSYPFTLSAAMTCSLGGRIVGTAGGNKDFQAFVMDEANFENWKSSTNQTQVLWQSGQVAATNIGVSLRGPATYYLVVSNVFSPVTAKTVQVQAFVEC